MQNTNASPIKKELILREKLALQRTHLANQATFLAFLRSSMYFMVAGLTVYKLSDHPNSKVFEAVLFIISAILIVTGIANYFINNRKIEQNKIHIGDYKLEFEQD